MLPYFLMFQSVVPSIGMNLDLRILPVGDCAATAKVIVSIQLERLLAQTYLLGPKIP